MRSGEFSDPTLQPNFEDAVDLISNLVEPNTVFYSDENDEGEYPGWDGRNVINLDLNSEVADQAGLGSSVRAQVVGDYHSEIVIIMRSRNLFNSRRFGFLLQPQHNPDGLRGLAVWQAPAKKPKLSVVYWGIELIDRKQAQPSSLPVSNGLMKSLEKSTR